MLPTSSDQDHLRWLSAAQIHSFAGKSVLDLGCGSGYLCHKAMTDGAVTAYGIDMVRPLGFNSKSLWQFQTADLDGAGWESAFAGKSFDFVLAFDILEHLASPFRFLESCLKVLSPQGRLVLTTPNVMSWERMMYPTSWSGVQDPQHKTLFTRYSLQFLLARAGFVVEKSQAPIRSLAFLGPLQPQIGGQLLCVAKPKA